jgi:hypothetical protein
MTDDLGYVNLDPNTLKGAEASAEADRASCVVRGAVVVGRRRSAAEVAFWRDIDQRGPRRLLAFTRGER